jgi:alcohol dehydrogenase (cytochrome c)
MRTRGAALWGNLVITGAGGFGNSPRMVATDKETGKVVWESSFQDTPDVTFTAAPLAIKDKIIVGAANGDTGVRDWIAGLDAATGKRLWQQFIIPAPGEPGSETWKGNTNAWRTGGGVDRNRRAVRQSRDVQEPGFRAVGARPIVVAAHP